MAMFLRQDEQRSEVQKRVAAEMQQRLRDKTSIQSDPTEPAALENQHTTRPAGLVLIVLLFLLAAAVVIFAIRIS